MTDNLGFLSFCALSFRILEFLPQFLRISDDTTNDELAGLKNEFMPLVFQKFEAVDENTVTYYMKTGPSQAIKLFKSDATTLTFTKGDVSLASCL